MTTSPTPEIAAQLNEHAPSLEVWGVNVYGSVLERLPAKIREVGWTRAYCVTEYGPTNWRGAPQAPSPTAAASQHACA